MNNHAIATMNIQKIKFNRFFFTQIHINKWIRAVTWSKRKICISSVCNHNLVNIGLEKKTHLECPRKGKLTHIHTPVWNERIAKCMRLPCIVCVSWHIRVVWNDYIKTRRHMKSKRPQQNHINQVAENDDKTLISHFANG